MDRVNTKASEGNKDNITKFKRDYRQAVVKGLRSLALIILLGTVVYGVWAYHDELSLDNIKRMVTYSRMAARGQSTEFSSYYFEAGLNTVYAPFEMGLAVVSSDTYRYISGLSNIEFSSQLKYTSPAICTAERQVLIYDRGSLGYCVANGYTVLASGSTGSPIISGTMNAEGAYALVTNENGYRGGVTVYSGKSKQLCKWQTPDYYIMLASINPETTRFAALCLREKDGKARSLVVGFKIGEQQPSFTIDLGEKPVFSMKHYKNGNLVILCEDGLYSYDENGAPTGQYIFASALTMFSHHENELPFIALKVSSTVGVQTRIIAFDENCNPLFDRQIKGTPRDMDYHGSTGIALFYNEVIGIDLSGEEARVSTAPGTGVRCVLVDGAGGSILVYPDRIERTTFE